MKSLNFVRSAFRRQLLSAVVFFVVLIAVNLQVQAQTSKQPVNVNTADLATLETLPGVGPATAQHIIDGRPYKSITDLEKVKGLGKSKADAMQGKITFGSTSAKKSSKTPSSASSQSHKSSSAATAPVNVNTADLATLETLPGVGATTAQRIIDGRPYSNLNDLEQVKGLSKTKVEAMKNQITFGSISTVTNRKKSRSSYPSTTSSGKSSSSAAAASQPENTQNENTSPLTPTGRSSSSTKVAPGEQININTANAGELDKLYGIGPTKAQAIIDYRNEHGPFQSTEDIMKVNGIKEGEFGRIKDNITVR